MPGVALLLVQRHFPEYPGAGRGDVARNSIRQGRCRGARANRVREHVQIGVRELLDQRTGFLELRLSLPGEADDDVGAETQRPHAFRDFEDALPVRRARVPAPHEPQHLVRTALQGDVQVGGETCARSGQQLQQCIVDLRRLDRRKPDARRHGIEHTCTQRGQRGARLQIPAVVPDVYAGDHQLGVYARQCAGFLHDFRGWARDGGAAREPGRAERALAVASVLHLEPGPGAPRVAEQRAARARGPVQRHLQGRQLVRHRARVLPWHHGVHLRHAPVVVLAQGGRTAGHQNPCPRVLAPQPPDQPSRLRVRLVGDGTGVHDQDIGVVRPRRGSGSADLQLLTHALGVVLVGTAPEGMEPDGRGRRSGSGDGLGIDGELHRRLRRGCDRRCKAN